MIDRLRARTPDGLMVDDAVWGALAAAYGEPGRHYHDLAHIAEVLDHYHGVAGAVGWRRPHEVFVAVLYHDIVYRPGRPDNESASATRARAEWRGSPVDLDRVAALIELTAVHGKLTPAEVDDEAALFLDCDMAILGADADRFVEYDAAVAREYAPVVPADAFAAGRAAFLERVLASPRIFLSDHFHRRLDRAARHNLGCALGEARFDAGAYWDAHEAWEAVWRDATDDRERHALQGLIQSAAALLQSGRDRDDGARRLLARAVVHFDSAGGTYRGIDLTRLATEIGRRIDGDCQRPLTLRDAPTH